MSKQGWHAICVAPIAIVAFGVALALAGCERTPSATPVTLSICSYPTQDFLPYFVMREQGLAKGNGLEFKEIPFSGGAEAIDAMAAGALDLCPAVGVVPLLIAASNGQIPEKAVAVAANNFADAEHVGVGVIVSHGLNGWKGLEGKKVASNARNSIGGAALEARLKQEGVGGYSFVEIPFANLGLALAGGNVAAVSLNEPYLTQSLLRGDGKLLGWVIGGPPLERTEFTTILFSAEVYRGDPESVRAFLRAHLAAVRWINEHPDAARQLLAKHLKISEDVARKLNLLRWPADAHSDPLLLDETQKVLREAGILQRPVDSRRIYDERFLAEVLKSAR